MTDEAIPPGSFVKIYGSILESSIWRESSGTRLLWITMLAIADGNGYVRASVGGLAHRANISLDDCRSALKVLESPDDDDRSGVDEGRRVTRLQGGWHIVNFRSYREMRTPEQIKTAERVKRHRDRKQLGNVTSVTVTAEGEAEVEGDSSSSSSDVDLLLDGLNDENAAVAWAAEINASREGMHGPALTEEQINRACRDYVGNKHLASPSLRHFRAFLAASIRQAVPVPRSPLRGAKGPQQAVYDTSHNERTLSRLEEE